MGFYYLVMSLYRVFSCVVGRGCFLWPSCSLGKTVSLWPLLFYTLRPNLSVTPGSSWLPTFSFQSPMMKRIPFRGVLALEGFVGLHRTVHLHLLQHYWLGHRFGFLWYWMFCLGNRDHSLIFDTASKYCISDSFVDYDGYSISSKRLLPTVTDIMVIWVKSTHFSPF